MSSDPHHVEEIFHRASDLSPEQRAAFLGELPDATLRRRVEELLVASAEAETIDDWEAPAILLEAKSTVDQHRAERVDRYKLLEPIGSGGMGIVYKAVRADDAFSKLVAVKIVHTAAADPEVLRRFVQERKILAELEHPNIARLIDGGATGQGSPLLAMEYVEGIPLARYLAGRNPGIAARLELFAKICSAVSYAHRNLIVHRDLKPGNILVTSDGEPKLLDFGIAKLLDGSADRTRTGMGGMTPEYASPEQARGAPITTASDIYSLGVLLFEMLTGRRPYRDVASPMELAQAIATETPQPLGPGFDSDLDTIVQMAMRKEPERRYASVDHLAGDLRRYRQGYPVLARPDSRPYRMRKFASRNKAGIAAAALVLAAIGAGGAATLREARIANRRFNDVRKLANSYLFEFHDAIKDLPGATPARQLVVTRALEYLDSLSQERGSDAALGLELATAYEKIADLQGQPGAVSLGDRKGALVSYRKAITIRESLSAKTPGRAADLGTTYAKAAALIAYSGDVGEAVKLCSKGIALLEKVASTPAVREALALNYTVLADSFGNSNYQNHGDTKSAADLYRKVQALREQAAAEDPRNADKLVLVATPYSRLGQVLQSQDDKPGAVAAYRRAAEISEQAAALNPNSASIRRAVAVGNRNLSLSLLRMNAVAEAQKAGDRAYEMFEQLSREDPKNVEARIELADGAYAQGYVRSKAGQPAEALRFYDEAVAIFEKVAAEHPADPPPPGLRTSYQLMADLANASGDTAKAMASAQRELAIDEGLLKADPANASAERNEALARRQIAKAHELNGMRTSSPRAARLTELRAARSWYQRSLEIYQAQKSKGTLVAMYASELVETPKSIARCNQEIAALGSRPQ